MTQRGLFAGKSRRQLPLTDEDCPLETPERPCPFVSCRFHLLVDQDARWVGNRRVDGLTLNPLAVAAVGHSRIDEWTDADVERAIDALPESCALDLALDSATEQTKVAKLMGLGRTLVEKIEHEAISKLRNKAGNHDATMGTSRPQSRHGKSNRHRILAVEGSSGGKRQRHFPWGVLDDSDARDRNGDAGEDGK